jgi:excisionase family DNA binding protein
MGKIILDMGTIMQKSVLTAQEAALYLGWSISYLYKKTMLRDVPHYKPEGKKLYFDRLELESWMKRNRVASKDELLCQAETIMANKKGGKK